MTCQKQDKITVKTQAKHGKEVTKKYRSISVPPPDGGWGWVVVFASFTIQAITNGVEYSFGLFFTKIANSNEIRASKSDVAWIGSIMLGSSFGAGIVASVFVNRFGCRAVCIAGGLIASFGFGISYWANGVLYLYLSTGVIGGLGLGLNFLPVVVCTTQYFKKRRALATGIAICGSGFGTFTLAPVFDFLISSLGWRAAFLGVAAITFLTLPLAALLRPLPTITIPTESSDDSKFQNDDATISRSNLNSSNNKTNLNHIKNETAESVVNISNVELGSTRTDRNLSNSKMAGGHSNPSFISSTINISDIENSHKDLKPTEKENRHNLKNQDDGNGHSGETVASKSSSSWLSELFDWSLFQNPVFLFFLLSNFLTNIGVYVPYIYYADLARGILDTEEGDPILGWLVSSMGIASIFGRIIISYLSDTKYVNRLQVYGGSLVLCGLATVMSAYSSDLTYLAITAVVFGASGGIYTAITSVILVDLLGLDKLTNSYGVVLFWRGVGSLIGPPIVGLFFDMYEDYIYGFWFAGISVSLSGTLMFLIPVVKKLNEGRLRERKPALC